MTPDEYAELHAELHGQQMPLREVPSEPFINYDAMQEYLQAIQKPSAYQRYMEGYWDSEVGPKAQQVPSYRSLQEKITAFQNKWNTVTRKDYQFIADAVRRTREKLDVVCPTSRAQVLDMVAEELAETLAKENLSFDRERFLAATKQKEKG